MFFESITSEILKDHLFARCNLCIEAIFRSSHPEVFLGKDVLKICSKFTGEHPCRSAISITLLCIFFIYKVDTYIQSTLRTPPGGCFWILVLHAKTDIELVRCTVWEFKSKQFVLTISLSMVQIDHCSVSLISTRR